MKKRRVTDNLTGYAFLAPSAILLLVFVIAPILITFYLSGTVYSGFDAPSWIGSTNYIKAFRDIRVIAALKNTLVFVAASVPVQIICSIVIAALIASHFRNRFGEFIRASLFVPVLCSATLIGTIFFYIFSSNSESLANMIIGIFGLDKVNWLGSQELALGVLIFVNAWKNIGYFVVIIYAGIMDIPNDLYEAAQIDHANKWNQFWHITLPNLKNVLFMCITVCTIWSFQFFDLSFSMTSGGPGFSTTSLVYELYLQAFRSFNFGYASAIAVILFLFVVVINLIQKIFMREE